MGKEKSMPRFAAKKQRHDPLHKQIMDDQMVKGTKQQDGLSKHERRQLRKEDKEMDVLDAKTSKKIMAIAQEQQREVEEEIMRRDEQKLASSKAARKSVVKAATPSVFGSATAAASISGDDDETSMAGSGDENEEAGWDGGNDDGVLGVDSKEMETLEQFFPSQPASRQTLADLITAKLDQFEADEARRARIAANAPEDFMNPKVMAVYSKVGKLLSRYKAGKLPKAFKIIPALANWEEVVYLTRPDSWTPHATYEATKIFVSNFNPKMAQRFLNQILLERVRDELASTKKLSFHLYAALKKSLYKPAAFFKGILLPLCSDGCTLREAAIVGSVVAKVSVPVLHSSAALLKLAEMPFSGATSLFLRILLDKKYALPYKVVDAIVTHFLRFKHDPEYARPVSLAAGEEVPALPVLWHQALLVFSQRYKTDITEEQRDALLDLIKLHSHYAISPEIRRELHSSEVGRGNPGSAPVSASMDVEMVDV